MLIFYCQDECHYAECYKAECHNAECYYAECYYAECHGALSSYVVVFLMPRLLVVSLTFIIRLLPWNGLKKCAKGPIL